MKHSKLNRTLIALMATLAVLLAACGSDSPDDSAAGDDQTQDSGDEPTEATTSEPTTEAMTYQVGVAMPLTGSQASLGVEFTNVFEYGIEDVNEQYADKGIQLEMLTEDTEATAEIGVAALNKISSVNQAPVVFTAWSSVVKAMAPVAEDLQTTVINIGANSPELKGASEYLLNLFPLSTVDIVKLATYVHDELDRSRAAIIYVDNTTGEGAADIYREIFEAAGGEVVAFESIRQDAVDASSQVAKVAAADPDVVHVHTLITEMPVVMKALDDAGLDDVLVTTYSAGETTSVREASGAAMDGLVYSTLNLPTTPEQRELIDRYKEEYDADAVISYDVWMYAAPFLAAEAIDYLRQQGTEVSGTSIRDAILEKKTFDLPMVGTVSFDDDGTVTVPVTIKQVGSFADAPSDDEVLATLE